MKVKVRDKKNRMPGAIAAAFVAAIAVYLILLNIEKNALSAYEKGSVLLAQTDITEGTIFTEENAEQYFAEAQVDKTMIPPAAVSDLDQLAGRLSAGRIDTGSVLTLSMLEDWNEFLEGMEQPVLAGFRAEDLYQVVSGTLRTGDFIHIYTVAEDVGNACLNWENVPVAQVFDASGNIITAEEKDVPAARINILLEQENVGAFYSELENGSLRVVKVMAEGAEAMGEGVETVP